MKKKKKSNTIKGEIGKGNLLFSKDFELWISYKYKKDEGIWKNNSNKEDIY